MKITIRYSYDPQYGLERAYWATAEGMWRGRASYAAARGALLDDLKSIAGELEFSSPPPPDEEIEI